MTTTLFKSANKLLDDLVSNTLSAVELLQCVEIQVSLHNSRINTLVTTDFESGYTQARAADAFLANHNTPVGPLHGLPLTVKDMFRTANMRTTLGNPRYQNWIPNTDAPFVTAERNAGAIIFAKSNTPDCAMGGITQNSVFGLTRNPWNLNKTTSGSGGGGAAALAAGMTVYADGSDIGGSVRSPACWANVAGFRPSSGWFHGPPGDLADGGISTPGIMARTVPDVCLFMQATAQPHDSDIAPYPRGLPGFDLNTLSSESGKPVIGWVEDFAGCGFEADIARCFDAAREAFSKLGYRVEVVDPEIGADFRELYADVNAVAGVRYLPEDVLQGCFDGEPTTPAIATAVARSQALSPAQIASMWQAVAALKARMAALMQRYPILVLPTHVTHAFDLDDARAEAACDWAPLYLAPMLGLPALSLPAGFTDDGMPWSVTLHGRWGEDMEVLRAAADYEAVCPWWQRRPPGYG